MQTNKKNWSAASDKPLRVASAEQSSVWDAPGPAAEAASKHETLSLLRGLDASGNIAESRQTLGQICLHYSGNVDWQQLRIPSFSDLPASNLDVTQVALDHTLKTKNLRESVVRPPHCSLVEWVAKCLFESISDCQIISALVWNICSCSVMCSGSHLYIRQFQEDKEIVFNTAKEYMQKALTYCVTAINDSNIFGSVHESQQSMLTHADVDSAAFQAIKSVAMKCCKFLFRIYAHIYRHHIAEFAQINAVAHLNCCFKRLLYFAHEYAFILQQEIEPLQNLVDAYLGKKDSGSHNEQPESPTELGEKISETWELKRLPTKNFIMEHLDHN